MSLSIQKRAYMNQKKWITPALGMCVFLAQAKPQQALYGKVVLNDTRINDEVKIMGIGRVTKSEFHKDVTVFGLFDAAETEFKQNLRVVGSEAVLASGSVKGDIHISNYLKKPKLVLKNFTVHGEVIFHGVKKGEVEMDSRSHIKQGIRNGEVK